MSAKYDVLSYGTIGMDVILRVPHLPSPDVSTHTFSANETLGGKATNTAAHLSAWGLTVAVSGTNIGDDELGQRVVQKLGQMAGISTRFLGLRPGFPSMYCMILVTPNGERSIIGIHTDSIIATPPTKAMITSAKLLTLDLYGGEERVQAARLALEAGIPVVAGDVRQVDHKVLQFTSIAIASAAELRQEYPDMPPDACARQMVAAGTSEAIITAGAGPILVFSKDNGFVRIDPPVVVPVDTTGAGDAFRAGVVYGKLAGLTVARAATIGAAAGALAIGRLGASTDPSPIDEVLHLAESLNVH